MTRAFVVAVCIGAALVAGPARAVTVFSTDFESGLPAEFSAPGAAVEPVQGYAGLGSPGNQFAGSFLRYAATEVLDTDLVLTGLPPHDTLSLGFLLAVIDSWDGVELLEVSVDGALVFSHSFQLATGDSSSYTPPDGGLISSGTNLGFNGSSFHNRDRAYDLSLEPAFMSVPHTADSVTIRWSLNATPGTGAGFWQGGTDESWAIDNVTVAVDEGPATTTTITTTTTVAGTTTTTTLLGRTLLLPAKKLLVKQKKSGAQRLQLLAKDSAISAATPCEVDGELLIDAVGAGTTAQRFAPPRRFALDAALWKPIKAKKPEKGCRYRKGPVVATVQIKTGKMLKVVANGDDLGVPLATDPRPVRIEVRHGDVRHCFELGGEKGQHLPDKKLLAKNAAPATACPASGSPSGAFVR